MKRVIALVLVVSMLMLTGCDVMSTVNKVLGKEESTTALAGESQVNGVVDNNVQTDNVTQTGTNEPGTQSQSQNSGNNSSNSSNSNSSSSTNSTAKKPETVAQIVEYFNTNGNRVKTEATKVVKNYEDREVGEIVASATLKTLAGGIMESAFKDDTEPTVYATREEIVENFQVPKQSYVSVLTANDVAEANCVDNGNQYVITIRVKDEINPVTGKGVGAAFDIIEASEFKEKAPSFIKDFSTEYKNCVVKAVFDKTTNRMVSANYMVRLTLRVSTNNEDGSVGLSFEKDYTITY